MTWLQSGGPFPSGGLELTVTYCTGTQTSYHHLPILSPVLCAIFGRSVYEGSLNLHAPGPVMFPAPAKRMLLGDEWLFAPVVLAEAEVGVAARKSASGDIAFIEVFAPDKLAPRLGLSPGARLALRMLPGDVLDLAA
jgi:hypothetical protein